VDQVANAALIVSRKISAPARHSSFGRWSYTAQDRRPWHWAASGQRRFERHSQRTTTTVSRPPRSCWPWPRQS